MANSLIAFLGTTGRAATTRYQFFDSTGALISSAISAGIFETPGARGIYAVSGVTFPANAVGVSWTDTGDATIYAQELFDFRFPKVETGVSGAVLVSGSNAGTTTFAALTVTGNLTVSADAIIGNLGVTGDFNIGDDLIISGDISVTGNSTITGTTTLNGAVLFGSTLTVTGATSFLSTIDMSAAVTFNDDVTIVNTFAVNQLVVAATTTLTGIVTASNAGNDIRLGGTSNTAIGTATNVVLSAVHGSGPWGYLPGPGPNAITVTVTDGSNDLQSAAVGLYQANVLIANGITDVNGNVTFSLAAGTYQVVVQKANYTFAPVNRTVTGPQTGTLVNDLVMTAISPISPPVNPALCNVFGFLIDPEGNAAAEVEVVLTLNSPNGRRPVTSGGQSINFVSVTAVTDGTGFFSQDIIRTDSLDQAGLSYTIFCETANINVTRPIAQATLDVADL